MIKASCSNCGKNFKAPEEYAGKTAKCPNCHSKIELITTPQITVSPEQIEDLNEKRLGVEKPQQIKTALMLLWVSLGIGVFNCLVVGISSLFELSIIVCLIAFTAALYYLIGKGKGWARLLLLILFLIGIPFSIPNFMMMLQENILVAMLSWSITVLQIIALVFLFLKPSSEWFRLVNNK